MIKLLHMLNGVRAGSEQVAGRQISCMPALHLFPPSDHPLTLVALLLCGRCWLDAADVTAAW